MPDVTSNGPSVQSRGRLKRGPCTYVIQFAVVSYSKRQLVLVKTAVCRV